MHSAQSENLISFMVCGRGMAHGPVVGVSEFSHQAACSIQALQLWHDFGAPMACRKTDLRAEAQGMVRSKSAA